MKIFEEARHRDAEHKTRRHFLKQCTSGLGGIALGSMMGCNPFSGTGQPAAASAPINRNPLAPGSPHFAPRAKRVIYLHMAGAPSQLELFDYKPELAKLHGLDCPQSLLEGKRFAFIQGVPKMLGPQATFAPRGESGQMVSDLLPYFHEVVDEAAIIKTLHTDEFNHAPAQLLVVPAWAALALDPG